MIQLKNITFSYGKTTILNQLNLEIAKGETIAVLGASGSGKSTLLNVLSGLLPNYKGNIITENQVAPKTSLVFQDYSLFPNLSVLKNLEFVAGDKTAIANWVKTLQLENELNKKPQQLSGGQKQRVAVARAMLCNPDLLLMDEPFSNLDTAHKNQLRISLKNVLKEKEQSTLLVTHDLEDAFSLADRIAVLVNGTMQQIANPETIYLKPNCKEILELTGAFVALPYDNAGYCRPEFLKENFSENTFEAHITGTQFSGVFYKVFYKSAATDGYFYAQSKPQNATTVLGVASENIIRF